MPQEIIEKPNELEEVKIESKLEKEPKKEEEEFDEFVEGEENEDALPEKGSSH